MQCRQMSIGFVPIDAQRRTPAPTPGPLSDDMAGSTAASSPRLAKCGVAHLRRAGSETKQVWALKYIVREEDKDAVSSSRSSAVRSVPVRPSFDPFDHQLIRHRKLFKTTSVSLIMELVDAVSLDQRLPNDAIGAVKLFRQVAEGLLHMHGRGYVHADIKPTNVLVTEKDEVKLIDLGQACLIGTVKKRIQGTPGYMAPEQAHRQAITLKTDIYNLGQGCTGARSRGDSNGHASRGR